MGRKKKQTDKNEQPEQVKMDKNVNKNDTENADKMEEESRSCIKFNPPMSVQRYNRVVDVFYEAEFKGKLKKVVDFGCSELLFIKYLKKLPGVKEIAAVDIDYETLDTRKHRAGPLATDYIVRRETQLTVSVYHGSIIDNDERLRSSDAVTCIELIEHLYEDVLSKVPDAIFGFIRPKVAIITTPNADFNVLFPTLQTFRHWDHKFEWTRKEFSDWCEKVVAMYPCYTFTTHGIGSGPEGTEDVGCCTQMAVFRLSDPNYRDSLQEITVPNQPYELVQQYEHPFRKITTKDIINDLRYYVRQLAKAKDDDDDEDSTMEVCLKDLLNIPKIEKLCSSEETIRELLKSDGWTVVSRRGGHYVQLQEDSSTEED